VVGWRGPDASDHDAPERDDVQRAISAEKALTATLDNLCDVISLRQRALI